MKSIEALQILAELTAYQWGMVTSAQAGVHGISRLDLSRLAEAGHLERLAHGVYRDAGAPDDQFDDLRAAWLSTDPKTRGEVRIKDRVNGVVVAGETAAALHGIGDFRALRHDFISSVRRQSQRRGIRYRQRVLDPRDVILVEGLPVMTMERTVADLVENLGELSLVAGALRDAARQRNLDLARLEELLAPLAERNHFRKGDGTALLHRLMEIAGIDPVSVARRVAADTFLGSRVAAGFLGSLSKADLDRLIMTPEMQNTVRSIQESITAKLQNVVVSPQLAELIKSPGFDDLVRQISAQFVNGDAMKEVSRAWAKSLSDSPALEPQTIAAIREALSAVQHG